MNKRDFQALYLSRTDCNKTGTRPPSCVTPQQPTISTGICRLYIHTSRQCLFIITQLYKPTIIKLRPTDQSMNNIQPPVQLGNDKSSFCTCSSRQSTPSTIELNVKAIIYRVTFLGIDLKVRPFELKL